MTGGALRHTQRTLIASALDAATRLRINAGESLVSTLAPATFAGLVAGPLLGPGTGWNAGGMHHADPVNIGGGRWLAAVDGWRMEDDLA